jgi:hypothetical protein
MGGSASRGSERINRIFSEKIFSESDQRPDGDLDFLPLARIVKLNFHTSRVSISTVLPKAFDLSMVY